MTKKLEDLPDYAVSLRVLGAWLKGLQLGGRATLTIREVEESLVNVVELCRKLSDEEIKR